MIFPAEIKDTGGLTGGLSGGLSGVLLNLIEKNPGIQLNEIINLTLNNSKRTVE